MIHFAYPNVKPSEGAFIGCGRYVAAREAPAEAYHPATPAVMDIARLQMAAAHLAPESFETDRIVYHKKDRPKEVYRGNSQHFAYLLALLSRSRHIIPRYAQSDIWCTGSIALPGEQPVLKPVAPDEFTVKLQAFLSQEQSDTLFIIPITVLLPEHEIILKHHAQALNVVTLKEFSTMDKHALASRKTILKLHGHELTSLVEVLFTTPEKTTAPTSPSFSTRLRNQWQYRVGEKIGALAIDAQGSTIVAGTFGRKAIGVNSAGELLWQHPLNKEAWTVALSPDGTIAVVGGWNRFPTDISAYSICCLDSSNGSLLWQDRSKSSVWSVAYSGDGSTLVAGTSDEVVLFDPAGKRQTIQNNKALVWLWNTWTLAVALSEDGSIIAGITGLNKEVRILTRDGAVLGVCQTKGGAYTLSMSSDGAVIAVGDDQGYLYCLNLQGKIGWREQLADKVNAVVVERAGQRLWSGTSKQDGHVRVYDQGGRLLWRHYVNGAVSTLAVSANGQCAAAGTEEGGIYLFDGDGTLLHQASAEKTIRQVAISADGTHVVAGSFDGVMYGFELSRS